jgi:hypothetical protein
MILTNFELIERNEERGGKRSERRAREREKKCAGFGCGEGGSGRGYGLEWAAERD